MSPVYLPLIPALCAIIWALNTKYQQRRITDLVILSISVTSWLLNAVLVYWMTLGDLSVGWHLVQMAACSIIVPLSYVYFARQVGGQKINQTATMLLWLLAALVFVPQIIVYNPFEPFVMPESGLQPYCFYVLSGGEKVVAIYMGDLLVILQCLVVLQRVIPFMVMLRRHNLHISIKVWYLGVCWLLIVVCAIVFSCQSYDDLRSPLGSWAYFVVNSLVSIFTHSLIAKGYDLFPVETETGDSVDNLDAYVQQQYSRKAKELSQLMDAQKLYLNPGLTSDQVIELLGTNHTYFSQMMTSEWGMSFSEYVNNQRFAQVLKLLPDNSLTIAAVATQCGFADAGYMSRKFKLKYGVTPTEWRKKHCDFTDL